MQRTAVREHDQRHGAQRSGGRRVAHLREGLLEVDPLKLGIVLQSGGRLRGELVVEVPLRGRECRLQTLPQPLG